MEDGSSENQGPTERAPAAGDAAAVDPHASSEERVSYHLTMVDGSETDVSLSADATVYDACAAASAWRGLQVGRLRLVADGQVEPLPLCRKTKLCDVTGGQTSLLVVIPGSSCG
ncbi:unnamed protein product [Symbiodinium sp. CCMP2592]|nr:unnamed protein product [Symbiodinium sp. CCMP2592]